MDVSCAILDNLMGRDRNKTPNEIKMKDHYSNKDVCKPFLICFCFHTLFPNTAYDDGPCRFKHDTFIKNMFDQDMGRTEYEKKYLVECIDWIQRRLSEVEIRIKKNKQMIDIKSNNPSERPKQIIDRLMEVDVEIQETIRQAEIFAENGQIFDSQRCMNDVERLREKKKEIELMGDSLTSNTIKLQKICETCGAIQVINDTEKRIQTHLEGKIHQGFLKLRHEVETLKIRLDYLNSQEPDAVRDMVAQKNQIQAKRRSKSKSIRREIEKEKQKAKQKQKQRIQKQKAYDEKYKGEKKKDRGDRGDRDRERQYEKDRSEKHKYRDEKDRSRDRKDKDRHRQKQRSREKEKKDKKRDRSREKDKRDRSDSYQRRKHRKDS